MPKFKLLGGGHYENKRLYKHGETITTRSPLDKMFVGKFERLGDEEEDKSEAKVKGKPKKKAKSSKGKLVDGNFEYSPEDTGLHVYLRNGKHFVYAIEDMEKPMNEKGMTKAKVLSFIASLCEE